MSKTCRWNSELIVSFGAVVTITLISGWLISAWLNGRLWQEGFGRLLTGELLSVLLTLLQLGHIALYRRSNLRRRIVSWLFLFATQLASCLLHDLRQHQERNGAGSAVTFAALFASLIILVSWLRRRRQASAE